MGTIDWGSIKPANKGGSSNNKGGSKKNKWIKLAGKKAVRPLGKPVEFWKFTVPDGKGGWNSAVTDSPNPNWTSKHNDVKPSHRYALNIIDREDGEVKILEGGIKIFEVFKMWADATGKNPGGKDGADFEIERSGSGKDTVYTTRRLKETVLTEAEIEKAKKDRYDLTKVYEPTPADEIEKKLFGNIGEPPANDGSDDETPVAATEDVATEAEAAGDDLEF